MTAAFSASQQSAHTSKFWEQHAAPVTGYGGNGLVSSVVGFVGLLVGGDDNAIGGWVGTAVVYGDSPQTSSYVLTFNRVFSGVFCSTSNRAAQAGIQ